MHLLEEIDSGTAIQMSSPWALYPEQVTSSGGPVDNHIDPRGRVDAVQTKLFSWHDLWYPVHLDACLVLKPCQAFALSSSEGSRKFHLWLTWPEWFSPASNQNCDFNRHSGLPPFSYSERLIIILMAFQYISPYCKVCEERENEVLLLCPRRITARWGWFRYIQMSKVIALITTTSTVYLLLWHLTWICQ